MARKPNRLSIALQFCPPSLALPGRAEGHRIETAELWTYDEEGVHRGSGGLEAHDRFAVAGFDLGALLAGGAA